MAAINFPNSPQINDTHSASGVTWKWNGTAWLAVAPDITATDIVSGTFDDARIAESNVTQHQAALAIAWGQLTSVPSTFTPAAHTLESHSDVTLTTIGAGELLKWDGAGWVNNTLAEADIAAAGDLTSHTGNTSNPHSVTKAQVGLSNVEDTALSTWAGSSAITTVGTLSSGTVPWALLSNVPSTFTPAAHTLDSHSNVTITTNSSGEVLKWNGSAWVNNTLAEAGIAAASHTHTASEVTDFSTAADARITLQKAAANGLATLDANSKIPTAQLPALALTDVYVVASEAAQLALTAQEGDVAVRTDQNKSYVHNGGVAGTMADWQELLTPTDAVLSVNGYTGTVTLTKSDVGLGNVENTTLSTWAGSANITTIGTLSSGTVPWARLSDVPSSFTPAAHTLDSHSNVTITSNSSGEVLKWNGSAWINNTLAEAGIAAASHTHAWADITSGKPTTLAGYGITDAASSSHNHTLDSLSNVTITTNSSGEVLKWSGTAWVNNTLAEAGIAAASHAHAAGDITSGTFADALVAQTNVTQHQAALSIGWGQLTSVPSTFAPAAHTLDSHSNVTITSNSAGEVLTWSGAAWVNNTLAEAGIAAASHVHAASDITSGTFADARVAQSSVTQYNSVIAPTWTNVSSKPSTVAQAEAEAGTATTDRLWTAERVKQAVVALETETVIAVACSDETTPLTTGTAKVTFKMPFAMTVSDVRASVTTAPTGSSLVADIHEGGTTILTNKLTIEASEFSTETATTAPSLADTTLANDATITINIDSVGSTVAGAGLKVYIIGKKA